MPVSEKPLPVVGGSEKRAYVRGMFAAIATRYDFLNHLLSLNSDKRWRRQAVDALGWERMPEGCYLDLCAGTLDLAAELGNRKGFGGTVIGADFVKPMLEFGRGKSAKVEAVTADALDLPFAGERFDGATVGFGVRNLMDLEKGLAEAARVLKTGARLVVLEFTTPHWQPLRALYLFYFRRILPLVGRLVSKHQDAYRYLPESVLAFPEPDRLAGLLVDAGFAEVRYRRLFGGIVAIHVGTRSETA
ncbi:MAG: ubiquinone/menaquinone biosynthesis methyltransferase [Gemmatimonadetes bacterium]|nr:ubiquinone/menaquinone biosynthesis methyltransferase [Gemmatimonadota bacterium]